jgi:hypothetical protein
MPRKAKGCPKGERQAIDQLAAMGLRQVQAAWKKCPATKTFGSECEQHLQTAGFALGIAAMAANAGKCTDAYETLVEGLRALGWGQAAITWKKGRKKATRRKKR